VLVNVLLSRWLTPFVLCSQAELYQEGMEKDVSAGMGKLMDKKMVEMNETKPPLCNNDKNNLKHFVGRKHIKYLNINLAHELWKDIGFQFLDIQHDDPPKSIYLFRLLWRWQLFNGLVFFLFLYPTSQVILGIPYI